MTNIIRRYLPLLTALLLVSGCSGIGGSATTPPSTSAPQPTSVPAAATELPAAATEAAVAVTEAPAAATEAPVAATEAPQPTAEAIARPAAVPGTVVLQLPAGSGNGQVGVSGTAPDAQGPVSFRIGADNSIRILDSQNHRLLFFSPEGKQLSSLALPEFENVVDFIVNGSGEVFVYGFTAEGTPQVIRYAANGKPSETIPVSTGLLAADGITLTSDQDIFLTSDNSSVWALTHRGVTTPQEIQPLTHQTGVLTPRSPVLFQSRPGTSGTPLELAVVTFGGGVAGTSMAEDSSVALPLPADMRFLNVDRGMNLYLSSNVAGETAFDVWRANPDGTLAGGAHIETDCALSWRRIYVDQGGDAWTLCAGTNGVTVTKYPLLDSAGQALAAPTGDPPAEVRWRPGTKFDAA